MPIRKYDQSGRAKKMLPHSSTLLALMCPFGHKVIIIIYL